MPTAAFCAAMRRSAAAISGRRCNSVEGTPVGIVGSVGMTVLCGMSTFSGFFADQYRDGMGILGAGDTETDQVGLGRFQGDPRSNHDGRRSRGDARRPLVL